VARVNSVVVAFMRFAKKRSSSVAIAWSFLPTMYHDGFVFHATLDTLLGAEGRAIISPCVAARTFAFAASEDRFRSTKTNPSVIDDEVDRVDPCESRDK
jgi:hypothetical protein